MTVGGGDPANSYSISQNLGAMWRIENAYVTVEGICGIWVLAQRKYLNPRMTMLASIRREVLAIRKEVLAIRSKSCTEDGEYDFAI
jgi:hypothetical protein